MQRVFRWNVWNLEHATKHGCTIDEIEQVVNAARAPYPEYSGDEKWLVRGQGLGGRYIQVIYLVEPEPEVYVIHARPLTDVEKRRHRRRRR